ncbi:hypothetical protein ACJMK2_034994 [Sinanodonta woodiana]|uniref:Uncharacterized protein n=1 Tax=Sinanodonta woodiana TaxID=1069815 RepID=A0ABD3WUX3_SINWO
MANIPKARIDMKHGFIKSIIRNQVDRDNYDKEVKASKSSEKGKRSFAAPRLRKPDVSLYFPPHKGTSTENAEKVCLFSLEFEDQDGNIHKEQVHQNDRSEIVAQRLGHQCQLAQPLVKALEQRIQEEIDKRKDGAKSPT